MANSTLTLERERVAQVPSLDLIGDGVNEIVHVAAKKAKKEHENKQRDWEITLKKQHYIRYFIDDLAKRHSVSEDDMRKALKDMTEKQIIELDNELVIGSLEKGLTEIYLSCFFMTILCFISVIGILFIPLALRQLFFGHMKHMRQIPNFDEMDSVYNYTRNSLRYICYHAFKKEYGENHFPFKELRHQISQVHK